MLKVFLRIVLTTVFFATANSIYCQTKWRKEPIYTPLLEKAELEKIEYKTTDYNAVGYVYKGQFIDGQNVTFLSKQTQDTIVSGRYYVFENLAYIDGLWKRSTENGMTRAYGLFQVKNAENENAFTIKPKEGKPLQINTKDIFLYQGFSKKYPATITKQDYSTYILTINYTDRNGEIFCYKEQMKIDRNLFDKYGFYAINDLELNVKDITRYFNEGTVFVGKVEKFQREGNGLEYEIREGKFTHTQGENESEELSKLPDGNFKYEVVYSNESPNTSMAKREIIVNKSLIEKYGYWETGKYTENTSDVKYTYKDGNIYTGKQEIKGDSIKGFFYQLTVGELKYVSGEEFEGDISGEWFCGVPILGNMKFTDGVVEEGNWFIKYRVTTQEDINRIESAKSPTEKRNLAKDIYNEKARILQEFKKVYVSPLQRNIEEIKLEKLTYTKSQNYIELLNELSAKLDNAKINISEYSDLLMEINNLKREVQNTVHNLKAFIEKNKPQYLNLVKLYNDFAGEGMDGGKYTDIQRDKFWNNDYKGKAIISNGTVHEVSERFFGNEIYITIKVSTSHYVDLYLGESVKKDLLMDISKGQSIKFSGELDRLGTGIMFHHSIINVKILK